MKMKGESSMKNNGLLKPDLFCGMAFGQAHVDEGVIAALNRRLDEDARRQLVKDIRYAPAWIAEIFKRLAAAEKS